MCYKYWCIKNKAVKSCDLTDAVGFNNLVAVAVSKAAGASVSSRGWEVSLVLYPSTAEDSVSQFVRLTLTLTLDQQVGLCSLRSQCRWKSPILLLNLTLFKKKINKKPKMIKTCLCLFVLVPVLFSSHLHPQPPRPL